MKSIRKPVAENSARLQGYLLRLFWRAGGRGLPIGYMRVPVAAGSQLLDPQLDALIGTGISGRTEPLGGNEVSGSPEGPKLAAYRL